MDRLIGFIADGALLEESLQFLERDVSIGRLHTRQEGGE